MFRTYSINEVERMCGVSRRTVSEYVAKGLLSGPSHRGRGARYPQADVDVLKLLPRFRTLMKREFPNLKSLAAFLRQLSIRDLHQLAGKATESSFVLEVRRLRVRNNLASLAPHVAPERIETMLSRLTPGQIRAVDSGRYQIGAVLDIAALLQDTETAEASTQVSTQASRDEPPPQTNGHDSRAIPTVAASWLDRGDAVQLRRNAYTPAEVSSLDEVVSRMESRAAEKLAMDETQPDLRALLDGAGKTESAGDRSNGDRINGSRHKEPAATASKTDSQSLGQRLNEISLRLERLEAILAHD